MINDAPHGVCNAKMEKITVGKIPHLSLFAAQNISIGQQVTYDYGDENVWWRKVNTIIILTNCYIYILKCCIISIIQPSL
jgi:hypothetical protein